MKHKLLSVLYCACLLLVQSPDRLTAQSATEGDLLRQLAQTPGFSVYLNLAALYRDQGRQTDAIRMLEMAIGLLRGEQGPPQMSGRGQAAPPPPPAGVPVRVGGDIRPPLKTKNVDPVYPESARAARLFGAVMVEFTIDTSGKVGDVHVIRSSPPFDAAAVAAVKQWEYEPTLLRGTAMSVIAREIVGFWP